MGEPEAGEGVPGAGGDLTSVKCPRCAADNDPQLGICFNCGASLVDLGPGSIVAERYEILQQIGKGGMGRIFKAYDRTLGEVVALKVLRAEMTQSEEMVSRFRNEVRLARKINHANVAAMYEYGVYGELHYISMELLGGVDLRRMIRKRRRGLDRAEAFGAVISIAAGLQAIHDAGIIHRDLKTENIIIDRGVVRLMDFGIAKGLVQKAGDPLTRVGMIMGTPQYMSPEQCQAKTLDLRTDIYSLGIVSHELFTATLPFDDESPMATMMLQIKEKPLLGAAVKNGLPKSMVPVLNRALAKDPDDRFASATEFQNAVEKARRQTKSAVTDRVSIVTERDRRQAPRVDVSINSRLLVVGEGNRIIHEEIAVADNIGGGGARVRSELSTLNVGQMIVFEEVGASFRTRAKVCGFSTGSGGNQRIHLKFLDNQPTHLKNRILFPGREPTGEGVPPTDLSD